ncbi:hypothetical protein [Prosthecobacter sp.]|uniref:hypothetical protein n=1 Tax=Prosthecobacter sp. TaxID=1965333 RepID=UPI002AB92DC3|nr:hypothetical protein [Prosthecobacter sp.]MDZ4401960.1 hypothetical protein [Prosthecobacter sp.]
MHSKIGILLLTWVSLAWCEDAKFTPPPAGINGWPNKPYDKVVGYQFANPDHISFIEDGVLALDKLKELKRKETVLNADQTAALLKATFEEEKTPGGALCYDPHHIIVFYFDDKPVGAIEICFHCTGARCWPQNKAVWWHTNFNEIGKLTISLGLGVREPDPGNDSPKSGQQRFPTSPKR